MYRTWNQLKAQRDNQGYSSTTAWLHIKKYALLNFILLESPPPNPYICKVFIIVFYFRLVRSEVEEECWLRREMEEDLAELREDHEQTNGERVAAYQAELAEWKAYERARVSPRLVCVGP